MREQPNQVLLTFDVEGPPPTEDDFNDLSITVMQKILWLMEERELRGIFFLTGLAAEKIGQHREIAELLNRHQVGYHSSSHSVKPRIIEYTDLASYEEAVAVSLRRETSHINPQTGEIEGEGGILALRKVFPKNQIVCFRAPFFGWSPPHLEALKKLGIEWDFSSDISPFPFYFKGITFYPAPIPFDGIISTLLFKEAGDILPRLIDRILLERSITVLAMHPSFLFAKNYYERTDKFNPCGKTMINLRASFLELLFNRIRILEKMGLIEVTASLEHSTRPLDSKKLEVKKAYLLSVNNIKRLFNYDPQFVFSHFSHFFEPIFNT